MSGWNHAAQACTSHALGLSLQVLSANQSQRLCCRLHVDAWITGKPAVCFLTCLPRLSSMHLPAPACLLACDTIRKSRLRSSHAYDCDRLITRRALAHLLTCSAAVLPRAAQPLLFCWCGWWRPQLDRPQGPAAQLLQNRRFGNTSICGLVRALLSLSVVHVDLLFVLWALAQTWVGQQL